MRFSTLNKNLRFYGFPLALVLLLGTFNNCGSYQAQNATDGMSSSVTCTTANCITENTDNLKITPNLENASYTVPADVAEFNIGGDCNEGGYPYNTIHWKLLLNGSPVRTSDMNVTGSGNANSRCVNGRFFIYINLSPITGQDPVNRIGLLTSTGYHSTYDLSVEVVGQESVGGVEYHGSQGAARVELDAAVSP